MTRDTETQSDNKLSENGSFIGGPLNYIKYHQINLDEINEGHARIFARACVENGRNTWATGPKGRSAPVHKR